MKKIVILFSGRGTNLAYIIDALHLRKLEVVAVLTNNPHAAGIGIAERSDIAVHIIDPAKYPSRELYDQALVELIFSYEPDLTVLAGFMRILTPVFTQNIRAINLHPSLLPRHKGLNAIEKSYHDNFDEGGVSVHWVSSDLDGGEVIVQKSIPKNKLDLDEYTEKIKKLEKTTLHKAILDVLAVR
jgi:phosphoribosylglycinamide formyltransferase-1